MMRQYKLLLQGFLMNQILFYRSVNQLTQEQMAELLHISPRSYFDLEHGKYGLSALTLVFFLSMLPKSEVGNLLDEFQLLIDNEG